MNTSEIYSSIIYMGLCIHKRLRIEHLRTNSYARHELYEKTADTLLGLVDSFAETAIGLCDDMEECMAVLIHEDKHLHSSSSLMEEIQTFIELLNMELENTALVSIADEMLVLLARFRYLHRLQ